MNNLFDVPVLLLIFNRPEQTAKIFEQISLVRPAKLYVAADGPRIDKLGESEKCTQARFIVDKVDWPCRVVTLFRDTNLGCREAVSSAVNWFFEQEEEGIILEDDCLPSSDFFSFCKAMLHTYRHDSRIGHICGSNFQLGQKRGDGSYYFSRIPHVWGWASWRRAWKGYDVNISTFPEFKSSRLMEGIPAFSEFSEQWLNTFERVYKDNFDTWDYQYTYHHLVNNRLAIIPNSNLIKNIGFDEQATHTHRLEDYHADTPFGEMKNILQPSFVLADEQADLFTINKEMGQMKIKKYILSKTWKKIKGKHIKWGNGI